MTGTVVAVPEGDSGYAKWSKKDSTVRGWMVKTMDPQYLELFLDMPTAKDMWEAIAHMFFDELDESQLYELRCKSTRIKQDGRELSLYFAEMKRIWQELDQRHPITMKCAVDIKLRQDEITKDRSHDFLVGLDNVYDQARSDLLHVLYLL